MHSVSVVPWLLVALASEHEPIRRGALACVKAARQTTDNDLGKCSKLMKMVDKQCEEISNDGHHIQNVSGELLVLQQVLLFLGVCYPVEFRIKIIFLLKKIPSRKVGKKVTI